MKKKKGTVFSPLCWKRITPEQAEALVRRIVEQDSDDEAAALVALLTCAAYDPDPFNQEGVINRAVKSAYTLTLDCEHKEDGFLLNAIRQAVGDEKGGGDE